MEYFVNDKLPSDYEYNYFKENPDEVVNLRSILYNMDQLSALIETLDIHEKEIFVDNKSIKIKKAIEKLKMPNNQDLIRNIINSEKVIINEKDKKKQKKKIKKRRKLLKIMM